jgi:hypothetical protein
MGKVNALWQDEQLTEYNLFILDEMRREIAADYNLDINGDEVRHILRDEVQGTELEELLQ